MTRPISRRNVLATVGFSALASQLPSGTLNAQSLPLRAVNDDYKECVKKLPSGWTAKYSCQLLTSGFTASAETLDQAEAAMVYTYTCIHLPVPASRELVEAQFAQELTRRMRATMA